MYTGSSESFDLAFACFEEQFKEYKIFVDYLQSTWHHTVLCLRGLRQPSLSPKEEERKQKTDEISYEEDVSMIEKLVIYLLFCKHIFLIHRINGLPFTFRAIPAPSTINTNQLLSELPLITSPDTTDESPSDLSTQDFLDEIKKYSRILNDLTEKKAKHFKSDQPKLDEFLRAVKESCSLVDRIGVASNALLPRQS
ncbi:hypothetical protein K501DRAFT_280153 [Backusella circina FSU 941]|nr:hypothetical protein K501DRAFT_280153 [Backusella circina FSU 941]